MQWKMLYPATDVASSIEEARAIIPNIEEYSIKTDTASVRSFYAPSKNGKTIIFYYGNKETMERSIKDAKEYYKKGYGVMACSYPLYDGNPGPANAKTLYSAVTRCLDFLNNEKRITDNKIIVHGHSIGGHMAIYAAQNRDLYAVILLAPLGSALEIARSRYPYLPVKLILQDHLVSYEMAKNIKAPLYLAHNIKDSVVPYGQGLKIYNNVSSKKKFLESIDYLLPSSNGHGDLYPYGIMPQITEFLDVLKP
jgi:dipeptidyl aminopeptidase/acylaminoacyl peptidase